ncbi:hypothetical protein [Demequina sp.]|uniref:hypothetical protein n=1 Tax=Demequina sp. TaxID=2050685 RepID=UPI003D0EF1D7
MKITSESSSSDQLRMSLAKYWPWAFAAAVTLAHLVIAARSVGALYVREEGAFIAGANVLAGQDVAWSMCGTFSPAGYAGVLAPLWLLPMGPLEVYQFAAYLGAAIGALAMWPATALAKRFGARGFVALAIGAIVTLVPARALMDNYVLSANLLTVLVLCSALLAVRIAQDDRRIDAALLGLSVGAAVVVDPRALPLAVVTVAWLVVRGAVGKSRWLDVAAGSIVAAALAAGGLYAQMALGAEIFGEGTSSAVAALGASRFLDVLLGQAFTQAVSWSLLTVLGLLACVNKARADARAGWARGLASAWGWLAAMVLAQGAFVVWQLTALKPWADTSDVPFTGSTLDTYMIPLAVLGATTLWLGVRARLTNVAAVAVLVAIVAFIAVSMPRLAPDLAWRNSAVPGLAMFRDLVATDLRWTIVVASGFAILATALLWISRGRTRNGVVVTLVVVAALSVSADLFRVDPAEGEARAQSLIASTLYKTPDHTATLAADLLPCYERNKLQLELAGIAAIVPADGDYGDDLVVGPAEWPEAEDAGWKKVQFATLGDAALWANVTGS